MTNHPDMISAIGNTPLIRLNHASEITGCDIWGKAEFLNPGQSVKDRAALGIVEDAGGPHNPGLRPRQIARQLDRSASCGWPPSTPSIVAATTARTRSSLSAK